MDVFEAVVIGLIAGFLMGTFLGRWLTLDDDDNATPKRMSDLLNRWRKRAEAQRREAEKTIAELNSKQ